MADVLLTHSNHLFSRSQAGAQDAAVSAAADACWRRLACAAQGYRRRAVRSDAANLRRRLRASAGAASAATGGRLRRQFQLPDQDVPAAQSRTGASMVAQPRARAGVPAIVNGSDATDHAADISHAGFACVLRGEVEETLVEVARLLLEDAATCRHSRHRVLDAIRRAAVHPRRAPDRRSGRSAVARRGTCSTPSRIADAWTARARLFLDEPGFEPRLPVPLQLVREADLGRSATTAAPPRLVAEEMLEVKTRFQPDHLWFADDIFALSPQWTRDFAAAVDALGRGRFRSRCNRAAT